MHDGSTRCRCSNLAGWGVGISDTIEGGSPGHVIIYPSRGTKMHGQYRKCATNTYVHEYALEVCIRVRVCIRGMYSSTY